jgi:hypothetical protein
MLPGCCRAGCCSAAVAVARLLLPAFAVPLGGCCSESQLAVISGTTCHLEAPQHQAAAWLVARWLQQAAPDCCCLPLLCYLPAAGLASCCSVSLLNRPQAPPHPAAA